MHLRGTKLLKKIEMETDGSPIPLKNKNAEKKQVRLNAWDSSIMNSTLGNTLCLLHD